MQLHIIIETVFNLFQIPEIYIRFIIILYVYIWTARPFARLGICMQMSRNYSITIIADACVPAADAASQCSILISNYQFTACNNHPFMIRAQRRYIVWCTQNVHLKLHWNNCVLYIRIRVWCCMLGSYMMMMPPPVPSRCVCMCACVICLYNKVDVCMLPPI